MKFKKSLPRSRLARDPTVKKLIIACLSFLLLQIILALTLLSRLPSPLPLFYSQPWGAAQLARKSTFWLFPFLTTVVFILNLVIAYFLFAKEKTLSWILIITIILFTFLILFTQLKIILLFW